MSLFLIIFFTKVSWAQSLCSQFFPHPTELKTHLDIGPVRREVQIFKPQNFSSNNKYPVLIYFHGTGAVVKLNRSRDAKFGLYYESQFIKKMTDAGFVVLAPKANELLALFVPGGVLAWESNIAPYSSNFHRSRDHKLMDKILDHLEELIGSSADREQIYLAGFSSGGYMSSRLAYEPHFANRFAGIIVHSASYGSCRQSACFIPEQLPAWHPRTLLIANKDDSVVPFRTVKMYEEALKKNQIPVSTYFHEKGDHAWMPQHASSILRWIQSSREEGSH